MPKIADPLTIIDIAASYASHIKLPTVGVNPELLLHVLSMVTLLALDGSNTDGVVQLRSCHQLSILLQSPSYDGLGPT